MVISIPTCGPMHGRVFLVVDGIDVGPLGDEILHDDLITGDDGQMERGVALLILGVEQGGLRRQNLFDARHVLVLGAVVQRGLARAVLVAGGVRL